MRDLKQIPESEWGSMQAAWPHGCAVYVIEEQHPGPVKVGIANHPLRRLSALQCGNPRPLFLRAIFCGSRDDCKWTEGAIHFRFAGSLLRGEWLSESLADIITEVRSVGVAPAPDIHEIFSRRDRA